jgi:hypothetical protein
MNKAFLSSPALILILSLFNLNVAFAQSSDISPYSRYGIGNLQDQSSALNFAMGGTGIAYHNDALTPFFVNLKNPASYAFNFIPVDDSTGKGGLKMAAFEAGIIDNILNLSTEGQTAYSNNAYLAYITIDIPVSRHFGLAAGLTPVSTEGYNITTNNAIDSLTPAGKMVPSASTDQTIYQGSGGINKVYVGAAYAPIKNLSFGANLSYLFGNLTNVEEIILPPNIPGFNTNKMENTAINSFYVDFGMMYTFQPKFMHDWSITIGATLAPSLNLNAGYSKLSTSQYANSAAGTVSNIDTIEDSSFNGKIRMPLMIGGGITIKEGANVAPIVILQSCINFG